ncbi:MAG: hypothetical protein JW908_08275 [Anaerolineales bacterium]|nr:hypothetical protein [Anaerolineales bacterium]
MVIVLLALSACNMPRKSATKTVSAAGMIYTAAAQTLEAELDTATSMAAIASSTPQPSLTPEIAETPSPTETEDVEEEDEDDYDYEGQPPAPPPPPTAVPCDHATYIKDVSYPDNTELAAGTTFVKTWRIKNTGACTWSEDYAVVFMGGDEMDTPSSVSMPHTVHPGETVDISVDLLAPSSPGTYRAEYKLRSDTNQVFGIGGNKAFWVQIKVTAATGLLLDFIANAKSAEWSSGLGSPPGTELEFDGAEDSVEGVAKIMDGVKLEDGSTSGKVLLTFPKHESNGYIMGVYEEYTVQKGDHFKARLGFMLSGDTCSGGDVYFQLAYKDDDGYHLIKKWNQTCNGGQTPVDVNLSDFKGRTIRFALLVTANGDPTNDWAIWNSPRIEHP